ncbi:MAG: carboxymuconolactone decarboxylase family protein [Candidatus Omnitrophica bacterium]|nr:carboxymuconolactone decarboxylase family protein [Candidatus Omnitrophota bacterium]
MTSQEKGQRLLNEISPGSVERLTEMFKDVCPDLATMIASFPYGSVYTRDGLDLKTREMITIASLVTLGFPKDQLRVHIQNALNVGCTQVEIVETILQMSVYAGFPAAVSAMIVAKEIFQK